MTEFAIIGFILLIPYSIIMTLRVFSPKTLIRWADYFAIELKEKDIIPLFDNEESEKPIEVLEVEVKE